MSTYTDSVFSALTKEKNTFFWMRQAVYSIPPEICLQRSSCGNMTRLLWSVHVHMVSTQYRILTSSFCRLTLYGLSLLVRTRNALQNELTTAPLQCYCYFLETTHCDKQFFLQTDSLQTLPTHQNGQSLANPS